MSASDRVEAAAALLGSRARRRVPLGSLTTYRVGGAAALFLEVTGEDDLTLAARAVTGSGVDTLVMGRGSNLLVADAGFDGLALVLGEPFAGVEVMAQEVRAGGAAALPVVARRTAAAGLRGLEWAVGVPGSVGGGVRMNAGGHGSDMAATIREVRVLDLSTGQDGVVPASSLSLGYRSSCLGPPHVVVHATFGLDAGDAAAAQAEVAEVVAWRRRHQPGGQNAGSIFTNPPGDSAGRLVEAAGAKGRRSRSAAVSAKHANFIQADPGGSADDVWRLILDVQNEVAQVTGVRLVPEVHCVGFAPTSSGG